MPLYVAESLTDPSLHDSSPVLTVCVALQLTSCMGGGTQRSSNLSAHTHTQNLTHTHTHTHAHSSPYVYGCRYPKIHKPVSTHTHIHTHTHTQKHTRTHTHT